MIGKIVLAVILIGVGGTGLAVVKPENALAVPFRNVATVTLELSSGMVSLLEETVNATAAYEKRIVWTALQGMRIVEEIDTPAVTEPTKDMAHFPSSEHPLFPDYIEDRYTLYKYTADSEGHVKVYMEGVLADTLLKIEQSLYQLEEVKAQNT